MSEVVVVVLDVRVDAPVPAVWAWPDALVAAVLAVCLTTVLAVALGRRTERAPALSTVLPAGGGLVAALAVTLLVHDRPVARIVAAAIAVLGFAVAVGVHRSRRRRRAREGAADGINAFARDDHRC